jgi:hypothetical protein
MLVALIISIVLNVLVTIGTPAVLSDDFLSSSRGKLLLTLGRPGGVVPEWLIPGHDKTQVLFTVLTTGSLATLQRSNIRQVFIREGDWLSKPRERSSPPKFFSPPKFLRDAFQFDATIAVKRFELKIIRGGDRE